MSLHDRITDILASAVENKECAGINVLVRRHGEEVLYTQAGMADVAEGRLIQRDSIFRLYSQTKPITAAAVMLLVERGLIDLMDGVDKFLPGFQSPQVVDAQGNLTKANRAPWIMELLGMTAGLSYPGDDPAGQYAVPAAYRRKRPAVPEGSGRHQYVPRRWGREGVLCRHPQNARRPGGLRPAHDPGTANCSGERKCCHKITSILRGYVLS